MTAETGERKQKRRKSGKERDESPFVTALRQFADVQGGYILAGQAEEIGVSRQLMSLYRKEGGPLIRYVRGLYRMRDFPESPFDRIIGEWYDTGIRIEAVISHRSAADVLGLTDEVSYEVHMTSPRRYRLRRPPRGVTFYFVDDPVPEEETFLHAGIPVTTVERTVTDLLATYDASEEVAAIIQRALGRRKTTMTKLRERAQEHSDELLEAFEDAHTLGKT